MFEGNDGNGAEQSRIPTIKEFSVSREGGSLGSAIHTVAVIIIILIGIRVVDYMMKYMQAGFTKIALSMLGLDLLLLLFLVPAMGSFKHICGWLSLLAAGVLAGVWCPRIVKANTSKRLTDDTLFLKTVGINMNFHLFMIIGIVLAALILAYLVYKINRAYKKFRTRILTEGSQG